MGSVCLPEVTACKMVWIGEYDKFKEVKKAEYVWSERSG